MMIVMTAEQAVNVAGYSTPQNQIRPIALAGGVTFVLPIDVLDDPAHADKRDLLLTFEQRVVSGEEWAVQDEL